MKRCATLAQQIARVRLGVIESPSPTPDKYRCTRAKRQRQTRLDEEETSQLVARYCAGATVYELADQFGCHRTTVSDYLKAQGVKMRLTSLTEAEIDQASELYESGLSLTKVGELMGANAETIRQRLLKRDVARRDPHGHQRA